MARPLKLFSCRESAPSAIRVCATVPQFKIAARIEMPSDVEMSRNFGINHGNSEFQITNGSRLVS